MPDIHFECPVCNQSLEAPEELANQLIECPTCRETIEVPTRSRPAKSAGGATPHQEPSPPPFPSQTSPVNQDRQSPRHKTCSKCGLVCAPAQSLCPKCGGILRENTRRQPRASAAARQRKQVSVRKLGKTAGGLARCRVCGKNVSPSAQTCPHCGERSPALLKRCPKCNSTRVTAFEGDHFGFGKAAAGAVVLGPLGLLAGLLPTKSTFFKCLDCGKQFM